MNLAEKLLTAVGIMTDAAVQKAGYDRTVVATVATVDDLETKTYTVQYGDAKHTAKGGAEYKIGDQVYVIIPGEDTLDWQISSLAQGVLIGDTWIDEKDIPEDNLVEVEDWETDNSLKLDGVYTNWVLTEIKERLKLYVRATFTVGEDLLTSNPLPEYGLIFKFNNREEPYSKTVNDMIGNPFKAGTHEQLFRFDFTVEEASAITSLESITFDNAGTNVEISDIVIYGTYSPDLGSAYPIECKIYREDLQILVTDSLISTLDTNNPHYVFTAQMVQGSVNLLEANVSSYLWERKEFDWETLTETWKTCGTAKILTIDNDATLYPITQFRCKVTYSNITYTSALIQVQGNKSFLTITPVICQDSDPKYYVTLTATPSAIMWKLNGVIADNLIVKGSLNSPSITLDASLISSPIQIYATDGNTYGTISLANIGRESSNIEVLNIATYMYNLGGELVGVAPRPLEAKFYDPQGNPVESGVKWTWMFPSSNTLLIDNRAEEFADGADQGSTCTFGLQPYYDITKTNNAIEVHAEYEGVTYIHTATIGILRTGEPGTNGTDISCKIGVKHRNDDGTWGNDIDYPAYEQVSTETVSLTDTVNGLQFSVKLENVMNGTEIVSYEQENVKKVEVEPFWFKWSEPDNSCVSWIAGQDIMCAKVAVKTFEWDNEEEVWTLLDIKTYYAYLPIARYYGDDKLKEGSGFAHIMYQPNGTNPSYYQSQFESENASNPITSITWSGVTGINGTAENPVAPPSTFSLVDGTPRNIKLTIYFKNEDLVDLPILFRYNAYGLAQVNAWDGSSVTLADGAVMAPVAGFGSKNTSNEFSGVLLGEVKSTNIDGETLVRTGIFGEYEGKETFCLNSKDGSATFGKSGIGQIIIDPSQEEAIIKSGNFTPDEENDFGYSQQGMQINLSKGEISAPSFSLKEDGEAHLAGWTVTPDRLFYCQDSKKVGQEETFGIYPSGISDEDLTDFNGSLSENKTGKWVMTAGKDFGITDQGYLFAQSGEIAQWKITSNALVKGNINEDSYFGLHATPYKEAIKFSEQEITFNQSNQEWRLLIGNHFGVSKEGGLFCSGGSIGGWNIGRTKLWYESKETKNAISLYGGEGGARFGDTTLAFTAGIPEERPTGQTLEKILEFNCQASNTECNIDVSKEVQALSKIEESPTLYNIKTTSISEYTETNERFSKTLLNEDLTISVDVPLLKKNYTSISKKLVFPLDTFSSLKLDLANYSTMDYAPWSLHRDTEGFLIVDKGCVSWKDLENLVSNYQNYVVYIGFSNSNLYPPESGRNYFVATITKVTENLDKWQQWEHSSRYKLTLKLDSDYITDTFTIDLKNARNYSNTTLTPSQCYCYLATWDEAKVFKSNVFAFQDEPLPYPGRIEFHDTEITITDGSKVYKIEYGWNNNDQEFGNLSYSFSTPLSDYFSSYIKDVQNRACINQNISGSGTYSIRRGPGYPILTSDDINNMGLNKFNIYYNQIVTSSTGNGINASVANVNIQEANFNNNKFALEGSFQSTKVTGGGVISFERRRVDYDGMPPTMPPEKITIKIPLHRTISVSGNLTIKRNPIIDNPTLFTWQFNEALEKIVGTFSLPNTASLVSGKATVQGDWYGNLYPMTIGQNGFFWAKTAQTGQLSTGTLIINGHPVEVDPSTGILKAKLN